ncbi:MAG: hypothetical protein LBP65_01335 [Puniceicoccales bacterium]|jgi:hypothetical protein|nr:hypothetical protein [Puniceicoccales bacterium]
MDVVRVPDAEKSKVGGADGNRAAPKDGCKAELITHLSAIITGSLSIGTAVMNVIQTKDGSNWMDVVEAFLNAAGLVSVITGVVGLANMCVVRSACCYRCCYVRPDIIAIEAEDKRAEVKFETKKRDLVRERELEELTIGQRLRQAEEGRGSAGVRQQSDESFSVPSSSQGPVHVEASQGPVHAGGQPKQAGYPPPVPPLPVPKNVQNSGHGGGVRPIVPLNDDKV